MKDPYPDDKAYLLFDGVCLLCDASVKYIYKRDKKAYFTFVTLQSEAGKQLLAKYQLADLDMRSVVLIENGKAYVDSDVGLRVMKALGGFPSLVYVFIIIPRPIRDRIYSFIARNRYRWFGKRDSCMIPPPEMRNRFLDT